MLKTASFIRPKLALPPSVAKPQTFPSTTPLYSRLFSNMGSVEYEPMPPHANVKQAQRPAFTRHISTT